MLSLAQKRLIGFAAIVGGILIVFLGIAQPNPFRHQYTYWAEFDSVQGLGAIGRDVRVAGVNVGDIGEVKREGDNALVQINLDEDVPLHTDARADMRPHTLFEGSSFIDLSPGSPSAPALDTGGTIPIKQTSNYVTLDEALRVLRPRIREDLRSLAEVGAKTLRPEATAGIQKTLRNAPALTRDLRGPVRALQGAHRVELEASIQGMSRTVNAVAQHEQDLVPLAQHVNHTAAALTVDSGQPLDKTLQVTPATLHSLRVGAPRLTGLVDRLDRFSVPVAAALPDFTDAVNGATPLLAKSIPVLHGVTPLIGDLRKISGRLADASPQLANLMQVLGPVSETFGNSVLPVLLQDSHRGPPTYEQLLATFAAADAVFSPYQTAGQDPLGAGHVWNIGTYIDPTGPLAGLFSAAPGAAAAGVGFDCSKLAGVNPTLTSVLREHGGCG